MLYSCAASIADKQHLVLCFPVARKFMAGSQMLRQLYFGALDMEIHSR